MRENPPTRERAGASPVGALDEPAPELGAPDPAADASTGEAAALWARYVTLRDPRTHERLVVQYAPLVKHVIGRLALSLPAVIDSDDILSYGVIGLLHAIDRFDPKRGIKFESYAVPRIRGAIVDALRSLDPLSRHARDRNRTLARASVELESELGRTPTAAEIAGHLGISVESYLEQRAQPPLTLVSLDESLGNDDEAAAPSREELLEDPNAPSPLDVVERRELAGRLSRAIRRLPERERLILGLYYSEELTMAEVSRVVAVSESRVCQLHAQAIARLRGYLDDDLHG